MKVSELIAKLEAIKKEHGDIPVGSDWHNACMYWEATLSMSVYWVSAPEDMANLHFSAAEGLQPVVVLDSDRP